MRFRRPWAKQLPPEATCIFAWMDVGLAHYCSQPLGNPHRYGIHRCPCGIAIEMAQAAALETARSLP